MPLFTTANLVKLALTVASASYSYYANKKMLQDRKRKPTEDDRPTATTTRGAYLPVLIGRRRLAPIISWVIDRNSSGGNVYETAGHLICVGPASRLHRIFENGKVVFSQQLEQSAVASGTAFSTSDGKSFTLYWGEETPPASGTPTEIGSLFPRVCYIVWDQVALENKVWPDFTYDIEVDPIPNTEGIGTTIVRTAPEIGDFQDIKDTQNGFPGTNFVEIEGDHVSEYLGANALIRFEEVPENSAVLFLGERVLGRRDPLLLLQQAQDRPLHRLSVDTGIIHYLQLPWRRQVYKNVFRRPNMA